MAMASLIQKSKNMRAVTKCIIATSITLACDCPAWLFMVHNSSTHTVERKTIRIGGGGRERCNIRVHDVMTYSATTSTKTCSVELSVMSSRSRLSRGDLGRSGPAPLVAMAAVLRMELRGRRGQLNLSESSIVLQARIRLSAKTHPQFDKKFVDSIRMVTE